MQDDCTTNSHYPQLYSSLYKVGRMQFLSLGVKGFISQIWGKSFSRWGFHKSLVPCVWGRGLHAVPFFPLSNWKTGASETTTACETGVSEVDGRVENGEESAADGLLQSLNYCGREKKGTACSLVWTRNRVPSIRSETLISSVCNSCAFIRHSRITETRSGGHAELGTFTSCSGESENRKYYLKFFFMYFFCKTSRIYTLKKTLAYYRKGYKIQDRCTR